ILGDMATVADKQLFRTQYGLDKPFLVRYFLYMKGVVLHGDLGTSYVTRRPVTAEVLERFPATLQLSAMSILLAFLIGITVGIISATRQYSLIDHVATSISMIGVSMPNFWQ